MDTWVFTQYTHRNPDSIQLKELITSWRAAALTEAKCAEQGVKQLEKQMLNFYLFLAALFLCYLLNEEKKLLNAA